MPEKSLERPEKSLERLEKSYIAKTNRLTD